MRSRKGKNSLGEQETKGQDYHCSGGDFKKKKKEIFIFKSGIVSRDW